MPLKQFDTKVNKCLTVIIGYYPKVTFLWNWWSQRLLNVIIVGFLQPIIFQFMFLKKDHPSGPSGDHSIFVKPQEAIASCYAWAWKKPTTLILTLRLLWANVSRAEQWEARVCTEAETLPSISWRTALETVSYEPHLVLISPFPVSGVLVNTESAVCLCSRGIPYMNLPF